jgi:hypothetical protein
MEGRIIHHDDVVKGMPREVNYGSKRPRTLATLLNPPLPELLSWELSVAESG